MQQLQFREAGLHQPAHQREAQGGALGHLGLVETQGLGNQGGGGVGFEIMLCYIGQGRVRALPRRGRTQQHTKSKLVWSCCRWGHH